MSARSQSSAQGRRPDSVASAMSSYSDASSYTSSARAASRSYVQGYGQAGATQDWPERMKPDAEWIKSKLAVPKCAGVKHQ